ncbi:MAG: serine hydrolase domain-containing protein [Bryobacteraceae bacterium]
MQAGSNRQFRVLYREFLFRMVDLELLSPHAQGDTNRLLGQFASLLVFLSVLFSMPALGFGGDLHPQARMIVAWSVEHFLIATTMLVVGLFAVLSWDSTFPDRRDVLVLAPLPIRARTMFLAKVAAVATALSLTVLTLHILAGLAWPLALNSQSPAQTFPAFSSDPAMPPVAAAELQTVLDKDLAQALHNGALAPGTGAGIAIGVSKHGVRRVFTYGAARPDSIFEIGSVSKTFTGLLLAQMAAQGKVKFDEPVRGLLPVGTVSKPKGDEIALVDLVTHHSGLPRMPSNFHPADKANPFADYHAADLYSYLAKRGVQKRPDASFAYSNLGFGLLGQALVNRAGLAYPNLVQKLIAGPLGMLDTVVVLSPEQKSRFIQGHNGEHHAVSAFGLDALAGAGAIRSTAGDMLTYLDANLHPERLPSETDTLPAALASSHQLRARAGATGRIALAWFYDPDSGTYWHGGTTNGCTADAFFNPKDDSAAIILSNTGGGTVVSADILGHHIRSRLAGKPALSIAEVLVPASGGLLGMIRLFAAYWITMLASGAFIFCLVTGVQGMAAQLLPRRQFLRASSFLQLGAFCLFVSVYVLQPILVTPTAIVAAQQQGILAWSPSYWFLGLFQELNGSPALAPLARRAWLGLGVAGFGTAAAYALSYFRTMRRIVEEPDIVSGSRGASWLPCFGNSTQTAVVQFTVRTLLRSRLHRVILAFYLGIGFAIAIFFLKTPLVERLSASTSNGPWHQMSLPVLASSILIVGFWVVGIRVAFSMPLDLRANWIFRITPVRGGPECLAARRRAMLSLSVVPAWAATAVFLLSTCPWRPVVGHLVVLGLLGVILVELCLHGVQKLPFTCSYLPGKSNFHLTFWLCIGLLLALIAKGVEFELHALRDPTSYVTMLVVLGIVAVVARWRTAVIASDESELQFDEVPPWQILTLNLTGRPGYRPRGSF